MAEPLERGAVRRLRGERALGRRGHRRDRLRLQRLEQLVDRSGAGRQQPLDERRARPGQLQRRCAARRRRALDPALALQALDQPDRAGLGEPQRRVRFLVAGALLSGWLLARGGRRRLSVPRSQAAGAAVVGAVILGDIGLLALAEQEVPAGLAAPIIASVPLWIVRLRLASGQRPARLTLAAVAAGFAGVALLVAPGGGSGAPLGWLLVLVGAAAIEATGQFLSPRAPLPADALVSTAVQLLAAGALLAVAGLAAGEEIDPGRFSGDSLFAFAYLVGPGSLLAYAAFVWLLANVPISTVSTYAYVNPVVAVAIGWLLLGEEITPAIAAGALAVLASVALIVRDRDRAAPSGTRRSRSSPAAPRARAEPHRR